MATQAEWNGFTWGVAPGCVRPIKQLDSNRSVSVERNEDKEGEPATQTVAMDLMTLDLSYTAALSATGRDPRDEYGEWWRNVSVYAPFYLNGRRFMADLFMLKSAAPSDILLGPDGQWLSATITLSFEEYAEDESGLKLDKREIAGLTPGVMTQTVATAVSVGPSDAQRQGKMPSNPGM
ncbi:hypothetical protein [Olsenella sp. An293]|uniref:hypothetical protein n=1 Tax=Olsenella sp. An293 TaxID=1965626 RepID=UPI000B380E33|nr:hypothetical protein [Olsenella sp. An293]OUO32245.1 hypothetical protein B5F85_06830 [Olsenella sp. An293]